MKSTLKIAICIITLTALIGLVLYMNGFPPEREGLVGIKKIANKIMTFPLFFAGIGALLSFPIILRKREELNAPRSKSRNAVVVCALMPPIFVLFIQIALPLERYGFMSDTAGDLLVLIFTACVLAVGGNYLSIIPYKARMGFKNKWTLSDPVVWTKTHRFLGKYILLTALFVTPIAAMIDRENAIVMLAFAVIGVKISAFIYSRMIGHDRLAARAD